MDNNNYNAKQGLNHIFQEGRNAPDMSFRYMPNQNYDYSYKPREYRNVSSFKGLSFKLLFFIASIILMLFGVIPGLEILWYAGLTMFILSIVLYVVVLILELDR